MILILLLVAIFGGISGVAVGFIPEPTFRVIAAFTGILFAVTPMVSGIRRKGAEGREAASRKPLVLVSGLVVMSYFAYVFFYMTLPAALTHFFGADSQREYRVLEVKKGGAKAILCPYRLKLASAPTVLDDALCIDEPVAAKLAAGQMVLLRGRQSKLGFRILSIEKSLLDHPPAVNDVDLPGGETGLVTGQMQGQRRDLVGLSQPSHRLARLEFAARLFIVAVGMEARLQ